MYAICRHLERYPPGVPHTFRSRQGSVTSPTTIISHQWLEDQVTSDGRHNYVGFPWFLIMLIYSRYVNLFWEMLDFVKNARTRRNASFFVSWPVWANHNIPLGNRNKLHSINGQFRAIIFTYSGGKMALFLTTPTPVIGISPCLLHQMTSRWRNIWNLKYLEQVYV